MAIELCASRTLSPYFGDSNIVWTSIIGVILASASIGNAIGGRLADRANPEKVLCRMTFLASACILYIPVFSDIILSVLSSAIPGVKLGAVIVAAICAACIRILAQAREDNMDAVSAGVQGACATFDTQYSRVRITNEMLDGEEVRYMVVGDGCESATYLDEELKYELPVAYTRYYDLMYGNGEAENALMLGGGGCSYPEYCVSHHGGRQGIPGADGRNL